MTAQQRLLFDPVSASMTGVMIAAVVLGALAVKTVTAEYSTGMIRATFTAMPARPLVLAAKAAAVAALAFPVTLLCKYMPGIATQVAVTVHRSAGLLSPGVALAVLGGYAALALTAASLRTSRSDA